MKHFDRLLVYVVIHDFQQPSRFVKAYGQMLCLISFFDYTVGKMVQQCPAYIVLGNIVLECRRNKHYLQSHGLNLTQAWEKHNTSRPIQPAAVCCDAIFPAG